MYDMPTAQEPKLVVRVTHDTADRLNVAATDTGVSRSEVVRRALASFLDEHEAAVA